MTFRRSWHSVSWCVGMCSMRACVREYTCTCRHMYTHTRSSLGKSTVEHNVLKCAYLFGLSLPHLLDAFINIYQCCCSDISWDVMRMGREDKMLKRNWQTKEKGTGHRPSGWWGRSQRSGLPGEEERALTRRPDPGSTSLHLKVGPKFQSIRSSWVRLWKPFDLCHSWLSIWIFTYSTPTVNTDLLYAHHYFEYSLI